MAVISRAPKLFVSAPAGSGKTRVLVERAAWLVEKHACRAEKVLLITFAKRAALELRERLDKRGLTGVEVRTFHAFAYRLLTSLHTTPFRLVRDAERHNIFRQILTVKLNGEGGLELRNWMRSCNWSPTFLVRECIRTIDTLRSFGISLSDVWQHERTHGTSNELIATACSLWYGYEYLLRRRGVYDFPLLISAAVDTFNNSKRTFPVSYRHILVDESQDAARDELQLLTQLAAKVESVTFVGDQLQALYGWRGARPLDLEGYQHIALKKNYRSDANIISFTNTFIEKVFGQSCYMQAIKSKKYAPTIVVHQEHAEREVLKQLVKELQTKGYRAADLLVLGRTNAAIERVRPIIASYPDLRALTVHGAKGLEAPVVILLNVHGGRFGFPQRQSTSSALQELVSYDQAREEQHIFYVAMTRARERLILLTADPRTQFVRVFKSGRDYRRARLGA